MVEPVLRGVFTKTTSARGSKKKPLFKKRVKIYIASSLLSIALLLSQVLLDQDYNFEEMAALSVGFGLISIILGFWIVRFRGNLSEFLRIFLLPFLLFTVLAFTLRQLFFDEISRIFDLTTFLFILAIYWGIAYVTFLAMNILYVSLTKIIPLVQVAQTTWYILTLAVVIMLTYWGILTDVEVWLFAPVLFILYFILFAQHLSHFELSRGEIIWKAVGVSVGVGIAMLSVTLWPTLVWINAFSAGVASYIGLGLVMHKVKKILDSRVVIEYIAVTVIFLIILFLTSDWGIYGDLFNI